MGVLFGGRSGEHEVSCASGLSVMRAVHAAGHDAVAIGVTREGRFVLPPPAEVAKRLVSHESIDAATALSERLDARGEPCHLVIGDAWGQAHLVSAGGDSDVLAQLDVIFPVLHGPYGEDGTLQGMLEMIGVAYVGSGVLASALAMDKVAAKRAFQGDGLDVADSVWNHEKTWRAKPDTAAIAGFLGLPLFVKPANLGSSVGISKAGTEQELSAAIDVALRYDDVFIVESAVAGREIECGVLGGCSPEASLPGEIIVEGGFYDYEAKYLGGAAETTVPADLPAGVVERVREIAVRAFVAVDAWGLARVDMFWDESTDVIYLNEVNTMPGFTSISMFSQMWEATGVTYAQQVQRLIELAFERHEARTQRAVAPEGAITAGPE